MKPPEELNTWRPTLEKTLATIEEDEIDPPVRMKLATAEREVHRMWREEAAKEWGSLVPSGVEAENA